MKTLSKMALVAALVVSPAWMAVAHAAQGGQAVPATTEAAVMTEGEVKKVNKETGKITLKHGELKNLNMPPMTMVFRVQEPGMLEQVQAGDAVNFIAERVNGQFTVTRIETKK